MACSSNIWKTEHGVFLDFFFSGAIIDPSLEELSLRALSALRFRAVPPFLLLLLDLERLLLFFFFSLWLSALRRARAAFRSESAIVFFFCLLFLLASDAVSLSISSTSFAEGDLGRAPNLPAPPSMRGSSSRWRPSLTADAEKETLSGTRFRRADSRVSTSLSPPCASFLFSSAGSVVVFAAFNSRAFPSATAFLPWAVNQLAVRSPGGYQWNLDRWRPSCSSWKHSWGFR